MEKLTLRGFCIVLHDSESFPIKKITLLFSTIAILALVPSAFAEQHNFTNTLPNYLEIEQNDVIFLKNLTNSTINLRHTGGLFSSGELYTNGTWTGNMPYEAGVYEWVNTNSTGTIVIKSKTGIQEPTVSISGNQLEGNVGSEIKNVPVAVHALIFE